MPRIPGYTEPQVQAQATRGGMMDANAPAGAFGAGIGQGLHQVAGVMDEVQQQADTLRVEAGQDLNQAAGGWFDQAAQEVGAGLTTDRQRRMFQQAQDRFRLEFTGQVQDHLARETAVVAKDTYSGVNAVEDANVAQNAITPDGRIQAGTIGQSLARKVHAAEQLSGFLGEGEDMKKARVMDAQSGTHSIVLDSLLNANQPQAAQTYFDLAKARGELDPKVIDSLEGKIRNNALANTVQAQADRISGLGVPLDQQDAEAQKAMAANPEGLNLLRGEIEHRFTIQKTALAAATQGNEGRLWDMRFPSLPGQAAVGMPQIMRSPEWQALDGTQRNELIAKWEGFAKRDQNDPATKVAQAARFYDLLRVTDVNGQPVWTSYTPDQVKSYKNIIGPENAIGLMSMIQQFRTTPPAAPKAVEVNTGVVESTLRAGGLFSNPDKLSDQDKSNVQDIETKLRVEAQASGKPLDYATTVTRVKELMKSIVTKPENWVQRYIPGDWNDKAPLFKAEAADPFPPKFYAQASDLLMQKGGTALDEANAQQVYLTYKNTGKLDAQGNIIGYQPNQNNLAQIMGNRPAPPPVKLPNPRKR